jgi:hypothetical protein
VSSDLKLVGFLELMQALKADPKGQALITFMHEMIDATRDDLELTDDHRFHQGRVSALRELLQYVEKPENHLGLHQEMGKLQALYHGATGKPGPEGD